jgi:Tfp pilus assembly PilM family ATPase/Tfp pilus assembly protein PilN
MARTVTGVDIGRRTTEFLRGSWKGKTFQVTDFAVSHHAEGDVAGAWRASEIGFKPTSARVGLTGRDVNVRYTRVPRVPDWQLRKLMRFEVEEVGGQSGSEVASDFNVLPNLPEVEGEDVVILAMAREALLEDHLAGLKSVGGTLDAYTPLSIALYNAWLRFGAIHDETVLLANIGHENLDVILVRGPDLLFARNLSGGGSLFDAAIAERFGVSPLKAEEIKKEHATLETLGAWKDANQEKASRACQVAAGQLLSLLQSTVAFCKSQVKLQGLRVDRVLLCGGGALLKGLPKYLGNGMNVPVELFDPFQVVDLTKLAPESAELLTENRLEAVGALGLATMASDPEAYSIEILPTKVAKARQFWGGTVFLIAAGVLALGYLGWEAWRAKSQLAVVHTQVLALDAQQKRAASTDRKTRELLAESTELAARAQRLSHLAGAGEQAARVLFAAESVLPPEFWVTTFTSERRFDDALGVPRGSECPIVHVEGRAREGAESTADQFTAMLKGMEQRAPEAAIQGKMGSTGEKFTIDMTLFAPPKAEPKPEAKQP